MKSIRRIEDGRPNTGIKQKHLVQFPVFADQPGGFATEVQRPDLVQKPFEMLPLPPVLAFDLAFNQATQKPAAGLAVRTSVAVQTL